MCAGAVNVVGGTATSLTFDSLGEFAVAVGTDCTRGIRSVSVETASDTWTACTLTTATETAITTNTSPRTGSCTLATQ